MQNLRLHKMFAAVVIALLLMTAFASLVGAASKAAPLVQQVRTKEVRGTIPGGQSAQIWLGLEPETSGAQVTVLSEWDRANPAGNGLNFFILDEQGVNRVGEDRLSAIAIGAGSPNFLLNGPNNVLGASFNAIGFAKYTIVVVNDSDQDANFTLRATNGFILDDSNNVSDPNAAPAETATDEAAEGSDTTPASEEAAPAESAPAATTAVTATTATTTTAGVESVATPTPAAPAPATSSTGGEVRATQLSGELPNQNDQHFIGLIPDGRDVQVTLRLTFDPQDNSELARRLNFWVLDEAGFKQFLEGADPSDVAIAAGNRVFRGQANERVASFRALGPGNFTVIVYNNATVPGSYQLSVENGLLVDDSGQTNESQSATSPVAGTGTVTGTTTSTTTATTAAPVAASTTSTTTAATRQGTLGGSYTVQSGDTLALIARDIYGDFRLYEQLCAFNKIANCNVIEVGDVIQLPTREQLNSGATAPAATPTRTPAAAAAATPSTPTNTGAATPVTSTTAVTSTTPVTTTTTQTTTSESAAGSTATGTIYETLVSNGNFRSLVAALQATGLDQTLDAADASYTLFAPTDAAFTTLRNTYKLTEAQLLALPELPDVLKYHVLSGAVMADALTDGLQVTTLEGKPITINVEGSAITVNGVASVIARDVEASNGVIHVIDVVVLPPAE
ncbi:MAG: fasciclin domain-containing protein [Caldilineaceae bacterium]